MVEVVSSIARWVMLSVMGAREWNRGMAEARPALAASRGKGTMTSVRQPMPSWYSVELRSACSLEGADGRLKRRVTRGGSVSGDVDRKGLTSRLVEHLTMAWDKVLEKVMMLNMLYLMVHLRVYQARPPPHHSLPDLE